MIKYLKRIIYKHRVFNSKRWRKAHPLPEPFPWDTRYCDSCKMRVIVEFMTPLDKNYYEPGFCPICHDLLGEYMVEVD